jgi:N-methylhydantoinase B
MRSDGTWQCPACDGSLGASESWQDGCVTSTAIASEALDALGVRIRPRTDDGQVYLDQSVCSHCGTQLDARIRVDGIITEVTEAAS